jgi:holo-[acyl-carrier protein] synthase
VIVAVGVDAVDVDRIATALARTPGFARRVFTERERAYCDKATDAQRHQRYGARFAAKEAVMKALGVGLGAFAFHDVEVVRAGSGAPSLMLGGAAAELAAGRGVVAWHLALTHTTHVATALVVADGQERPL